MIPPEQASKEIPIDINRLLGSSGPGYINDNDNILSRFLYFHTALRQQISTDFASVMNGIPEIPHQFSLIVDIEAGGAPGVVFILHSTQDDDASGTVGRRGTGFPPGDWKLSSGLPGFSPVILLIGIGFRNIRKLGISPNHRINMKGTDEQTVSGFLQQDAESDLDPDSVMKNLRHSASVSTRCYSEQIVPGKMQNCQNHRSRIQPPSGSPDPNPWQTSPRCWQRPTSIPGDIRFLCFSAMLFCLRCTLPSPGYPDMKAPCESAPARSWKARLKLWCHTGLSLLSALAMH